nr:exo-alpha-sialidase [Acidobacteriota bacterium]
MPGAWLYASRDRGAVWEGPYQVPAFDTPGLDPRTDYLVTGPRTLIAGMTAFKPSGKEGRPLAIQTRDGGRTWQRLGWIGPETDGFRIMPALARLGDDELYAVVRRRDGQRHSLEGYRSDDAGLTWTFTTRVVPSATSPPRSGHPRPRPDAAGQVRRLQIRQAATNTTSPAATDRRLSLPAGLGGCASSG